MTNPDKSYDAIILGAGAAGLFCAITAAKNGNKILVIEKSNKVGKKILMQQLYLFQIVERLILFIIVMFF